jgi:SWI/SNF-related matrix-associated actin-dependent regulator 1 of chromatin subfamily A
MKFFDMKNNLLIIQWKEETPSWLITKDFVKTLEGRTFDPTTKVWKALATEQNISMLIQFGFIPSQAVKDRHEIDQPIIIPETPRKAVDKSKLPSGIYPYQIEGVEFLEAVKGKGLLADPVGLGKTIQSISYCMLHPEIESILVICPSTLKINWQREIQKWAKEDSTVLYGTTPFYIGSNYRWFIINYDVLTEWQEELLRHSFDLVIADEAQAIKNKKAKRTKAFLSVVKHVEKKIFISATPIKNRPSEFYNILHELDIKNFYNEWKYLNRYCDPKYTGYGIVFKGLTHGEELYAKIKPLMIRREKAEVLKDLPEKIKTVVHMPMERSIMMKYDKANQEFKDWAKNTYDKKALDGKKHIELLRQIAYLGKRNAVIQWIETFLESDEKLIIFAWHKNAISDIKNVFKDIAVVLDGKTSSTDKQKAVDSFQNDPEIRLFIGNIQAAGVGITLTAASNMAIIEFPWSPGDLEQAEGRHHRIGQKADSVSVYYLVGSGTVDEDTAILLNDKSVILNKTMDGIAGKDIFGMDIADMLIALARSKG